MPFILTYSGVVPSTALPGTPTGVTLHAFHVEGADLASLTAAQRRVAVKTVNAGGVSARAGFGVLGDQLFVLMPAGAPAGIYTVTVTLPDGRHASVTFRHPA